MKCILSLIKMPLKVGIYALLIGFGTLLGVYSPTLYAQGKAAITWFTASSDKKFDPQILLSPEKELDLIQSINNDVGPRLRRVQILIRKQQAEIEYLREKSCFIENRVPCDEENACSVKQRLSQLAAEMENGNSISQERCEFFKSIDGPTWVALRNRSQASEKSLKQLFALNERVQFLQDKLEKRRLATLQYVPVNNEDRIQSPKNREVLIPEIEEAKGLLEDVHETLFKTVYALDPVLLKEADALVQVSSLTQ